MEFPYGSTKGSPQGHGFTERLGPVSAKHRGGKLLIAEGKPDRQFPSNRREVCVEEFDREPAPSRTALGDRLLPSIDRDAAPEPRTDVIALLSRRERRVAPMESDLEAPVRRFDQETVRPTVIADQPRAARIGDLTPTAANAVDFVFDAVDRRRSLKMPIRVSARTGPQGPGERKRARRECPSTSL
jgi:hypothetical protein